MYVGAGGGGAGATRAPSAAGGVGGDGARGRGRTGGRDRRAGFGVRWRVGLALAWCLMTGGGGVGMVVAGNGALGAGAARTWR